MYENKNDNCNLLLLLIHEVELFDMFCKACRSTDKETFVMFQIIPLKKAH